MMMHQPTFFFPSHQDRTTFEAVATDHLRLSGVYWGTAALACMGTLAALDADETAAFVSSCARDGGACYGGGERHDGHLLHTLSAVQVAALIDRMDIIDGDAIAAWVATLQQPDGSFTGDAHGEVDTRFSYCALSLLSMLGRLDAVDVGAAGDYVLKCANFDAGFGATPGGESHAGQVFVCVAALAIAGRLADVDADALGWWLAERQAPGGGLNGRPQKLPDVCYSWWCLSALALLGRTHWIDGAALTAFILACQDPHGGGVSDRADDAADVYHTFFGVAGLSLLGHPGLDRIDPTYALPAAALARTAVGK